MAEIDIKNRTAAGRALKAAFPPAVPVMTGFIFPGIAYGILMQANGYGVLWAVLMSAVAFCGSMQYAAVPLLVAPFDPLGAFLLALMVNARHIFYGISMLERFSGAGKLKFFLIYLLCDESYSVIGSTPAPEGVDDKLFCFFISLLNYLSWIASTAVGSLLGHFIPQEIKGLNFMLTALFAAIFLSWWDKPKCRTPALLGVFITAVCRVIFGTEYFLLPALAALLIALLVLRGHIERGAE